VLGGGIKFEEAVPALLVVVKGGGRDHFSVEYHALREEAKQEAEVPVVHREGKRGEHDD
jgi:hypothetical protein